MRTNLVVLTDCTGKPVLVNIEHVAEVYYINSKSGTVKSQVRYIDGHSRDVKEPVTWIVDELRKAYNDNSI